MDIFITGATGYIGGSVAARLIEDGHRVTGLARTREKAAALRESGIEPVLGTLDDAEVLAGAARRADAVVNAADSDHHASAAVLVEALAGTGKPLLHTSGSSIVSTDARGEAAPEIFTEADVVPGGGPWQPAPDKAARVAIDRLFLAAADRGVRTVVLCNTLIYGHGHGLARDSAQLPRLVRQARASGVARHIGAGHNIWSTVHIDDVTDLYAKALESAPPGSFHFVENGETDFVTLTQSIADALGLGRAEPWPIEAAVEEWGRPFAAFALGSNSRVRGVAPRAQLGWSPRHASVTEWIKDNIEPS